MVVPGGGNMRKQRIEYDSPVDALVAIAKRFSIFETRYRMASEEFFDKFSKGQSEGVYVERYDGIKEKRDIRARVLIEYLVRILVEK